MSDPKDPQQPSLPLEPETPAEPEGAGQTAETEEIPEATSPCSAETASEEIDKTIPQVAPLPDPKGDEDTLSPVDLPPSPEPLPHPFAWMTTAIVAASLVLALFNAGAIRGWAYELTPGPTSQRVVAVTEWWYDATARLGFNRPVDTMRGWWKSAQGATFGNDQAPQDEAPGPEPVSD